MVSAEEAVDGSTSSDQEFTELIGFLQDPKLEVQRFAAEGVLAQTESKDFLEYCRRRPRAAAKSLLRLVERAEAGATADGGAGAAAATSAAGEKSARAAALDAASSEAAGAAALQALVNLSAVPSVLEELQELSAPKRCAQALRSGWLEGRSELAHWHAMLLANLTTAKRGQEALSGDESLLRFLLAAYVANPRPPPRDGYDDPLFCLGKAIGNICALEEGRRLLTGGEGGPATLVTLMGELGDRTRRPDVLNGLRNVCLDKECHGAVVATNFMTCMASFLYPWDKVQAEHREKLPEQLRTAMAEGGAALTGDAPVRHAAAVSLLGLCRTLEGREYLRAQGCPEVARAWHQEETQADTKGVLEAVLPAVSCSEEEFKAMQEQATATEAAAPAEAAAAAAATAPPPAAAEPKPEGAAAGEGAD